MERRSESRTAVQLGQGSGVLGQVNKRAVSIETPVSVCGRRNVSRLFAEL